MLIPGVFIHSAMPAHDAPFRAGNFYVHAAIGL
jgi:hypothetical protein